MLLYAKYTDTADTVLGTLELFKECLYEFETCLKIFHKHYFARPFHLIVTAGLSPIYARIIIR